MPRSSHASKGKSERITLRFDRPTNEFYRRKANEAGVPVAEFCRQILVRGIVNDNVEQIEKRLNALLSAIPISAQAANGQAVHAGGNSSHLLPTDLVRAIYLCREVLTTIVSDRNIQFLHQAQDRAEAATKKLLGESNG
ncbi:hypothetical protein [Burkholderia cenocepacia]|jgi:hypothetical protein|uniref:Mobilization protein n=1 Tax=Burkholderia cenocepacia TaxID=95486 RepID=A0ABD4UGI5_9BURK|nr:hypothetical protein [Burkholderia cenocepacia]MCW3696726.1 hypothetical protein [Burkholderia cenocepacia]MCW3704942.1 hypothetical protein [Burkholderia cenocepacia]MCW3713202.1 hypothetical protein [Burkholderia cenocepacia]MCW3721861.1 hypothetical protein [Burkholderia cenocepacia]MCW3729194.1 hypothetical protein [Burkholderia cenocepacia]